MKRVLLVEDEDLIAQGIMIVIEDMGYSVTIASSLDEAIREAGTGDYAAALVDLNLRGGHSYPVADILRERGIPFAMTTGAHSWAPSAFGKDPFLMKPYQIDTLERLIRSLASPAAPPGRPG